MMAYLYPARIADRRADVSQYTKRDRSSAGEYVTFCSGPQVTQTTH